MTQDLMTNSVETGTPQAMVLKRLAEQALPYILIAAVIGYFVYNRVVRDHEKFLVTQAAPDFELRALIGSERVALETFRGKPIVMIFWSIRGPRVREAMLEVEKSYREYADRDLVCIGLNIEDSPNDSIDFVEQHGLTFLQLKGAQAVMSRYHIMGVPTFYVVDRQGIVRDNLTGWTEKTGEQLRMQVRSLMK